jgi:D-glycero-D-manno-heptose 1,7-bisphosphate phosphatase
MNNKKHKTIFLDRDGTLNVDVDYLSRVDDLEVFPFAGEALEILKTAGHKLVVVTNQSGIGRGYYDEATLALIHDELQRQVGHTIDGFYFCPHVPDAGCECRKPKLKMIADAGRDLDVDFDSSWMIGDKDIDVELGFAANLKTVLVRTGYGRRHESRLVREPDIIAENLLEAAKRIVEFNS